VIDRNSPGLNAVGVGRGFVVRDRECSRVWRGFRRRGSRLALWMGVDWGRIRRFAD
jgi:hypothetical protein